MTIKMWDYGLTSQVSLSHTSSAVLDLHNYPLFSYTQAIERGKTKHTLTKPMQVSAMHTYDLESYCPSIIVQGQLHLPPPFFQAPTYQPPGLHPPSTFRLLSKQELPQCLTFQQQMYLHCQPLWYFSLLGQRKEHGSSYIINNKMIARTLTMYHVPHST